MHKGKQQVIGNWHSHIITATTTSFRRPLPVTSRGLERRPKERRFQDETTSAVRRQLSASRAGRLS